MQITNQEWLAIIGLIKTKKDLGGRHDKIVKAFEEVNKGGNKPEDGSIELKMLSTKIKTLTR